MGFFFDGVGGCSCMDRNSTNGLNSFKGKMLLRQTDPFQHEFCT